MWLGKTLLLIEFLLSLSKYKLPAALMTGENQVRLLIHGQPLQIPITASVTDLKIVFKLS
jgi:hypothetical protein